MQPFRDLLAAYDIDGIGGGVVAAAIVALMGAFFKAARHTALFDRLFSKGHAHSSGAGDRSIVGYCIGWLLIAASTPIVLFVSGQATPGMMVVLITLLTSTIPMVGWLDRYALPRRIFGGSNRYEGAVFTFLAFLLSALLMLVLTGTAVVILRLF